jgi:hypothetical protein
MNEWKHLLLLHHLRGVLILTVEFFSEPVQLQLQKIRGIRTVHHVLVFYNVCIVCIRGAVGKYTATDDIKI